MPMSTGSHRHQADSTMSQPLLPLTDADLLDWHHAGDPDACAALFERHQDRIWKLALRVCGDPDTAADAVHHGVLAAFGRAPRGDIAVGTWLHRLVLNACLDRLRERRARRTSGTPSETDDLGAALGRLPEAQRLALVLVDMHGLEPAEAAQVLGVTQGTLASRCPRGRAALAQLLGVAEGQVRRLLAAQPDPGPMPQSVELHIRDTLAEAAAARAHDRQLFDELGLALDPDEAGRDADDGASKDPVALEPQHRNPGGDGETDGESHQAAVPPTHHRWRAVVAAAAGVGALAILGAVTLGPLHSGSDALGSLPGAGGSGSAASVPTAVTGAVHVQVSASAYTPENLPTRARALLTAPGPEASAGDAASAGLLVTSAGVDGCVAALGEGGAAAVSIDIATYAGQPAAIVVVTRDGRARAYAVQRDCASGDPQIIHHAVQVP